MNEIWIEIGKASQAADLEDNAPLDRTMPNTWQALFACQVWLRPFAIREKYKWGFNLGALLEEALDRQRHFIEAQHTAEIRLQHENPDRRSLALRATSGCGTDGVLLGLVGKTTGLTAEIARHKALEYAQEVLSTFPYDYELRPAATRAQFRHIAGWEILQACQGANTFAHVRRFESPYNCAHENLYLLGSWRTTLRSDEVIWRALAGSHNPVLMNITLQPILLLERERALLASQAAILSGLSSSEKAAAYQPYLSWATNDLQRRSAQVMRSYALQVHFACPAGMPEYLPRVFGTAVTRDPASNATQPTFLALYPVDEDDVRKWKPCIYWLEMLPVRPLGPIPGHILDLATVDEAHAVFRFPFTPQLELPGVRYLESSALDALDSAMNRGEPITQKHL